MDYLPDDLVPIPSQPWDERPGDLPLVVEEVRTALWRAKGNITEAAALLKTRSSRVRGTIKQSEYLQREVDEAREQILDKAEDNIKDALYDSVDVARRDSASKFILQTIGRKRGYGSGSGGASVGVNGAGGRFTISWADGTSLTMDDTRQEKVIDHVD